MIEKLYRVAGRCLSTEAADEWSDEALADLFQRWFITPLPQSTGSVPNCTLRIRNSKLANPIPEHLRSFEIAWDGTCYTDNETFYLEFDGSIVVFRLTAATVDVWIAKRYAFGSQELVTILSQALSAALRRCDVFELHSAGVIAPESDTAILIAGPSGSGKSTATLQLALAGWRYVSDDVVWLTTVNNSIRINALRRFFALTTQTAALTQVNDVLMEPESRYRKTRFDPQHVLPTTQVQQATPDTIVFTSISGEANSHVQKLDQAQTMSRLIRLCPWSCYDTPIANSYLQVLQTLARSRRAFELAAGTDLIANSQTAVNIFNRLSRDH